jgi:hypothetical protein
MNEFLKAWRSVDRNNVALLLSVIPGAGHLYKHHYASGLGILIGGNILMVFVATLLSFATLGISLILVPLVYWLAVGAAAYAAPDWHGHHHWLHPWSDEEQ